jgi:hypothetical protein
MTIETLLECEVSVLEKMTDDELLTHFQPYLVVCQPPVDERKTKVVKIKRKSAKVSSSVKRTLEEQMKELADLHSIDLDAEKARNLLPPNLR